MYHLNLPLLLLLVHILVHCCCLSYTTATGVTQGTIVVKRGANANSLTSSLFIEPSSLFSTTDGEAGGDELNEGESSPEWCNFDAGIIHFSHPMSLKSDDKFFSTGQLQLKAIEMMIDEINIKRCGVLVDGKRYGIQLTTYGDDSSKEKVGAILQNGMKPSLTSHAITTQGEGGSFWLGPYSSGLTGIMSPYANATNTILLAGGAAATSVFQDYDTIFGTFPPTAMYLAQAIEALAKAGASSAAAVWEDASFTRGVCAALPSLAEQYGLEVQSMVEVVSGPTANDLDPVAMNLSATDANPDIVVTCVYDSGCNEWIASLRRANWSPRAQVFTVCIGMDSFVEAVGVNDAMYMSGISPWDPSLAMKDDVVGWSAAEFAELFLANTQRSSTYHSASAASSVGALVQAIERANSFDTDTIRDILATEDFTTLYGKLRFDTNGQSMAPSLFLQYDSNTTTQTVYPLESR